MTAVNERVEFRLIKMECCNHLLCWVNPRMPSHCPECGRGVYPDVRSWVTVCDANARLRFDDGTNPRLPKREGIASKTVPRNPQHGDHWVDISNPKDPREYTFREEVHAWVLSSVLQP